MVRVWDVYSRKTLVTYTGHTAPVNAIAWSADGQFIASAGYDKTVQIWNVFTGVHGLTYGGHTKYVSDVCWSPDNKYIASSSADKTVHVWIAASGSHVFTYDGHLDVVSAIVWSPDGKFIASASNDKTVHAWGATKKGNILIYPHANNVYTVSWSPDGQLVASAGLDKVVHIWKTVETNILSTQLAKPLSPESLYRSATGSPLAIASLPSHSNVRERESWRSARREDWYSRSYQSSYPQQVNEYSQHKYEYTWTGNAYYNGVRGYWVDNQTGIVICAGDDISL